ncbi:MAG: AsmA-like C-terminal region-containing protein, partial [Candidatus Rokubacteria bacterium]|nr:AsmA-like C-terminal region-containing protein [Candidatus Rokubacteria bacterium]
RSVRDLVALAAGPEPVIAGGVSGTLTVGGTLGEPRARGEVTLSNLAVTQTNARCAEPTRRTLALGDLQASAVWEGERLASRPLRTGLGGGSVTANLAVTLDRSPRVDLDDLTIKAVPLDKVLVDFLCQGYAVTGPLDLSGQAAARLDDFWRTLNGSGQLRIGPGQVVGAQALGLIGGVVRVGGAVSALLSADLPASRFSSPLDFDSITASYQITKGVVTTRDLRYVSRAMRVAAAGTYALVTGAMNLDVVVSHGRGEVKARVTGTAASPSIRVVPSTILGNVDPGPIERGVQDLLKRFR